MELMVGVPNKRSQAEALTLLDSFETLYVTDTDQMWALQKIHQLRFRNAVTLSDCLIAAVAHRLQVPLYTHNLKVMTPLIGALAVRPYP
jgi:predicted nucleic acid-binding protein